VLSQGKSSRLYKRLVYDEQIATGVTAFNSSEEIGGQFRIRATSRPGDDLTKVEKAIDEELARLLEGGPTALEMERAKAQRLAGFVRGIERVGGFGGKSDLLAGNQIYLGSPDAYKASLKRRGRVRGRLRSVAFLVASIVAPCLALNSFASRSNLARLDR
jgi:zinc protease